MHTWVWVKLGKGHALKLVASILSALIDAYYDVDRRTQQTTPLQGKERASQNSNTILHLEQV